MIADGHAVGGAFADARPGTRRSSVEGPAPRPLRAPDAPELDEDDTEGEAG